MDTVKGFKDVENASKRIAIRNIIENVFKLYGFIPVETPVIEYEKFVKGENADDEAVSDIFKLKDRGDRKLALRYEFTFQLKRLAKNKKLPYKIYNIGSVFRDEPVTGNRWRQFTQCDADIIGVNLKDVGEILKLSSEDFQALMKSYPQIKDYVQLQVKHRVLENFLHEYSALAQAPLPAIRALLEKLTLEKVGASTEVISEGDNSKTMFIVKEGRLRVYKQNKGKTTNLAFLRRGDFFGELSFLKNCYRSASVEALTDTELYALDDKSLQEIVQKYYPGRDVVDWIGIDGFNWHGQDFEGIFKDIYWIIVNNSQFFGEKPLMLCELGAGAHRKHNFDKAVCLCSLCIHFCLDNKLISSG